MSAAFYYWRGARWRSRRQMVVVAQICGLPGVASAAAIVGLNATRS